MVAIEPIMAAVRVRDDVDRNIVSILQVDDGEPSPRRQLVSRIAGLELGDWLNLIGREKVVALAAQRNVLTAKVQLPEVRGDGAPNALLEDDDARFGTRRDGRIGSRRQKVDDAHGSQYYSTGEDPPESDRGFG